jgi:hypothetical protein
VLNNTMVLRLSWCFIVVTILLLLCGVSGEMELHTQDEPEERRRRTEAMDGLYIETFIGTGTDSSTGDDGLASSATISSPEQIWIDGAETYMYVADFGANQVRRVDLGDNIITTFAGTGTASSSGDGGQASSATINGPKGVHGDTLGNVYITEYSAHTVRIVSSTGIIELYAGTSGTSGAATSALNLLATSALLNFPWFLAGDTAANVYIADSANNIIRKVLYTTRVISTYAGGGSGGDNAVATSGSLNTPAGIFMDSNTDLYIGEYNGQVVKKVTLAGVLSTVAGSGIASMPLLVPFTILRACTFHL